MWLHIMKPNAFGQLYLIGEAASAHHAWIVGALESAVRGVYYLLDNCYQVDQGCGAYQEAMKMLSQDPDAEHTLPFILYPKKCPGRRKVRQRATIWLIGLSMKLGLGLMVRRG